MNMHMRLFLMAGLLALAGCAGDEGEWPRLLPTDAVLAEPALPPHARPASSPAPIGAEVAARAAALRRRAEALGGPVIEPEARERMTGKTGLPTSAAAGKNF